MTKYTIAIATMTLLTLSIGTARAEMSELGAGAPAPAAESDVSTLNGQLIQVGNQHFYKYSYPRINISTNPLSAIFGIYGLAGSYALTPRIAIKADGIIYDIADTDITGFEFNVTTPIYFRKMYRGLFLEPGLMARKFSTSDDDNGFSDSESLEFGPQVLVGVHAFFDSGINISVAGGAGRSLTGDKNLFANGYARIGYAF